MSDFDIFVLTNVNDVRHLLKAHLAQQKFNKAVASHCRAMIDQELRELVASNYVHNALLSNANSQKLPGDSTPDMGQKYYVFAMNAAGAVGGFASCVLQTEKKGSRQLKVVYLDVICSAARQGKYIMNAAIAVAKSYGADLMRLSALPHVIGYYRDKFGFSRHPAACYPDVSYRTFKRKTEQLENWQVKHAANINTSKLYEFGQHRNGPSSGYAMSLCLQKVPVGKSLNFASSDVNWQARSGRITRPKITRQRQRRFSTTNLTDYYGSSIRSLL